MSLSYSHDHLVSGFRIFRVHLFPKPETGQELFFAVSYSKPAVVSLNSVQKQKNHDKFKLEIA